MKIYPDYDRPYHRNAFHGPVDENGNRVQRTKITHPYSYDGFVVYRMGNNEDINECVYSDRMDQWDYKKYRACAEQHLSKFAGTMSQVPSHAIEKFLRAYFDNPQIRLILVMEYCNQSSGYPVWRFDFNNGK